MSAIVCLNDQCRSPTACGAFGYCREHNIRAIEFHFPIFRRWASVIIDNKVWGYMERASADAGPVKLHIAKRSPNWLAIVRGQGPWPDFDACGRAIKAGAPHQ